MKIAIDARMIDRSGIGTYTRNLVKNLVDIDGENSYSVITNGKASVRETANLSAYPLKRRVPIYGIAEQVVLPREIANLGADLVHYPSFNMPLASRGPSVVTIHDLIYYLFPDACPGRAAHVYARFMFRTVPKLVRRIIADTEYTKADIVEHLRVDPEKITVVPLGVEAAFRPVTDMHHLGRLKKKYGIRGDCYILYTGTHQPRKNLVRLIRAFSMIKGMGLKLVITGQKEVRRSEVYDTVARLGMEDRVVFTGLVPEKDLPGIYTMASLFAFPSLYEGFGLPPLEAMACGAPVVASSRSSMPEVLGDAALYADPVDVGALAEAMKEVLVRPGLAETLRGKGLERVKGFNWRSTAEKTLDVYRSVFKA